MMPVGEQAAMASADFQAYARRRKVRKEGILCDNLADSYGMKRGHSPLHDEAADKLLSLELDAAEALADFWRMVRRPSQQPGLLRWTCKRKRTGSHNRDSMVPSLQLKQEPEDALSAAKKNRSSCTFGRDSSISDRDEIESAQCSKEFSSFLDSRAQSPSSPLPPLQLPCGTFRACESTGRKSAFQKVLPSAPCLLTVKAEIEDMHSERLALGPQHTPVRRKPKIPKIIGSKVPVKIEPVGEYSGACLEEVGANSASAEIHNGAGLVVLSNKSKSSLSEKEKEARRLRRIQANRESARQTIRKKQVLCEELTKKASSLALENKYMKQRRDSLMQELLALQGQNFHLKQQLEIRSSGNSAHDSADSSHKMPSDSVGVPVLQPISMPYAGAPPPAFIWVMAAAAAANQAYTHSKQENWDANSSFQHEEASFVLPSLLSCKPEAMEQSINHGNSSPTLTETPLKEKGLSGVCGHSHVLHDEEPHCDSLHTASHPAKEFASGNLSGKPASGFSAQTGCLLTAAGTSKSNVLPVAPMNSKSRECVSVGSCVTSGTQIVPGATCGYAYSGSVPGYPKGNPQVNAMQGKNYYAAIVAAEARRRRKELTRSKFLRSRSVRPAAVSC